jgi:hypothetical protein
VAIVLSPATLPPATKNSAYSSGVTASGGTAPYTYAVTVGALPAGLSLNASTGAITGTPTSPGYFAFTIRATDNVAATGSQAYTLYVSGLLYWFICTNAAYPSAIPVVAGSQAEFNRRTANALAGMAKTRRSVGDLLTRPVSDPINNHLLCDGSAVLRTGFPQLFDAIGTAWGAGDGSTTFNIPNLLGTAIPNAITAPAQTITDTTVAAGGTITEPSNPGETGGSDGGNIISGGRDKFSNFL